MFPKLIEPYVNWNLLQLINIFIMHSVVKYYFAFFFVAIKEIKINSGFTDLNIYCSNKKMRQFYINLSQLAVSGRYVHTHGCHNISRMRWNVGSTFLLKLIKSLHTVQSTLHDDEQFLATNSWSSLTRIVVYSTSWILSWSWRWWWTTMFSLFNCPSAIPK